MNEDGMRAMTEEELKKMEERIMMVIKNDAEAQLRNAVGLKNGWMKITYIKHEDFYLKPSIWQRIKKWFKS